MKKTKSLSVCSLVIISIIMILPFLLIGQLGVHSDWSFHASRVQQLYLNIQRGHWFTYIGTDTFSKVGNANFVFYPVVFLYPWALLKFIFSSITAYLLYVWLLFLATLLIAFFCMQSFNNHQTEQSMYFAIIYAIAPYHLYLTLSNYVLGEAQAYTFIPIVMLGMYNLLYKNKWIMLAIGMSLMAYCHYVSLFICLELCVLILVIYWIQNRKISLSTITSIVKSIGLFLLLSLWQFVPLITDYFHKGLVRPNSGFMLMESAGDFVVHAINNDATNRGGIGLLLLLALLFGWKQLDKNSKYMWIYAMGVLLTWMITTAFPWHYFSKTPLSIIQFPYRYTSFAAFFLAVVLSKLLTNIHFNKLHLLVKPILIGIILLFLYGGTIYNNLARNKGIVPGVSKLTHARRGNYKALRDPKDTPILIDNDHYNDQFSYGALYGETDYMPLSSYANSSSVLNRHVLVNGHKKNNGIQFTSDANSLTYKIKLNKAAKVDIPVLHYQHTLVTVNHKRVHPEVSNRGTISYQLNAGENDITVSYKASSLLIITRIISLISWLFLVIWKLFQKIFS